MKSRKTRNKKKKEELKNVASCGTAWGLSDNYDEDVIWPKYAISLANLAALLC